MPKYLPKWRTVWRFAPAILVLVTVTGLIARAISTSAQINNQYRIAARQAIADDDLEQADFYYSRLIGAGDQGSQQDQLNWVSILGSSGRDEAAREMLDRLAPDDEIGYAAAHRQKAVMASGMLAKQGASGDLLEKLHWHLKHGARDSTLENDLLWANYHLAVGQSNEAIERFDSAASRNPSLWYDAGLLYRKLGNRSAAERAMGRAESLATAAIEADPLDSDQRVRLAALLAER